MKNEKTETDKERPSGYKEEDRAILREDKSTSALFLSHFFFLTGKMI